MNKNKIRKFLKDIDSYKYKLELNAFGENNHSTFLGGIGSILYFGIVMSILGM